MFSCFAGSCLPKKPSPFIGLTIAEEKLDKIKKLDLNLSPKWELV